MKFTLGLKNLGLSDAYPPGLFSYAMGTAVVFSNGNAVAYSGLGIYNPPTATGKPAVKLLPSRITYAPTSTGTNGTGNVLAISKFTGTATTFAGGASSGVTFQQGVLGTSTNSVATVFGTGSFPIAPQYVEFLGALGTAVQQQVGNTIVCEFEGAISVLPGEAMIVSLTLGGTGFASMVWTEVPL